MRIAGIIVLCAALHSCGGIERSGSAKAAASAQETTVGVVKIEDRPMNARFAMGPIDFYIYSNSLVDNMAAA